MEKDKLRVIVFEIWNRSEFTLQEIVMLRDACSEFIDAEVAAARQKIAELQQLLNTAGIAPPSLDDLNAPYAFLEKKRRGRKKKVTISISREIPFPCPPVEATEAAPQPLDAEVEDVEDVEAVENLQ